MHADFGDDALAEEIGFILRQVHIVLVAQRAVHDHERMECERCELECLRINPTHGTRGLQAEAGTICKAHREIVGIACIGQALHVVNIATQIVCAKHAAVFDFRDRAIVTAMYAEVRIAIPKHVFEALVVATPQAILRVVEAFPFCPFDEIDDICVWHFRVLFDEPRKRVHRVVVDASE